MRLIHLLDEHTPIKTDGLTPDEIVTYYENYFAEGRDAILPDLHLIAKIEAEAAKVWYELGLYQKYGYDYSKRSYQLIEGGASDYDLRNVMQEQEHIQDVFKG